MKRLLEIAIVLVFILLVIALIPGCGHSQWATTDPTTESELLLISETARFAKLQGVDVVGEITETPYIVPAGQQGCPADHAGGCYAAGWLQSGVAYYYRPIIKDTSPADCTNIAAHEVAHAISPYHDAKHWCASAKFATPTYPPPVAGLVCS